MLVVEIGYSVFIWIPATRRFALIGVMLMHIAGLAAVFVLALRPLVSRDSRGDFLADRQ